MVLAESGVATLKKMLKIKKPFSSHCMRSVCCSLVSTPVRFLEQGQGWVSASSKLRLAVSVFRRTEPSWKRNKKKKKKAGSERETQKHMERADQTATRAKQIQPLAQVCHWKAGFSSARGLFVIQSNIIRDALTHFGFILQIPYTYCLGFLDNNIHFPPLAVAASFMKSA